MAVKWIAFLLVLLMVGVLPEYGVTLPWRTAIFWWRGGPQVQETGEETTNKGTTNEGTIGEGATGEGGTGQEGGLAGGSGPSGSDDPAGSTEPGSLAGLQPPADMASLARAIEAYTDELYGMYGVYAVDLASGESLSVHGDEVFPTASTFKLPMAAYILHQVELGRASLDERLIYEEWEWEEGTGSLQEWLTPGDALSVRELLHLAITESDNIATNMLLHRFGRANVYAFMRQMGGTVTETEEGRNGTTPREMALYLTQVYRGAAVQSETLRGWLLDELGQTVFHDRIEAGVPEGIPVAHKIGTLPGVVNDVGLVMLPGRSFVVAVFSSGVDEEEAAEAIATITRMIFDYQQAGLRPVTRSGESG